MNKIITFLAKLGFWKYVTLFTILAVVISEFLMIFQSLWLTGSFFDKNLMIVGFITPAIDAFVVFLLSAFVIRYLTTIQNQLSDAQKVANIGFWEFDSKTQKLYWSDEVYRIFGLDVDEFEPTYDAFIEHVHPEDRENLQNEYAASIDEKRDYNITHRVVKKDDTIRYVEENCRHFYDKHGEVVKSMGTVYDITDRVVNSEKMQKLFDLQTNIVLQTDGKKLKKGNRAFLDFFDFSSFYDFSKSYNCICDRFEGNDEFFHLGKVPKGKIWTEILETMAEKDRIVSMLDKNSIPHAFSVSINHFEDNDYIVTFSDISETITENKSLQKRVQYDTLTNAYSRDFFENNIDIIQKNIYNNSKHLGILIFDIDKFKKINDTFGHSVGDTVLKTLVDVVKHSIREEDILIRWGGEEFIILLEIESIEKLSDVAEHIRVKIESNHFGMIKHLTCSFGITLHKDNETINKAIERSDKALYISKNSGRNQVQIL